MASLAGALGPGTINVNRANHTTQAMLAGRGMLQVITQPIRVVELTQPPKADHGAAGILRAESDLSVHSMQVRSKGVLGRKDGVAFGAWERQPQ